MLAGSSRSALTTSTLGSTASACAASEPGSRVRARARNSPELSLAMARTRPPPWAPVAPTTAIVFRRGDSLSAVLGEACARPTPLRSPISGSRYGQVAPGAARTLAVRRHAALNGIRRQQRADDQPERHRGDVHGDSAGPVEDLAVRLPLGGAGAAVEDELVAVELARRVEGAEG